MDEAISSVKQTCYGLSPLIELLSHAVCAGFQSCVCPLLSSPQSVDDYESLGPCVIMASPGMMQVCRRHLPLGVLCFLPHIPAVCISFVMR